MIDSTSVGIEEMGVVTVEMVPVRDDDSLLKVALVEGMTLEDLIKGLTLPQQLEVALVNGAYVSTDYPLKDGDRVSIFPVLSGG